MSVRENEFSDSQILVAIDFSDCSRRALHKAKELISGNLSRLLLLHVIDQRFVDDCVRHNVGPIEMIKKKLFIKAKSQLTEFLKKEIVNNGHIRTLVCEGIPHVEIARHAEKFRVDLIILGSRGMAGDPDAIFFGGTAEKVMRFISRPVLCIPPSAN